jgi:hypothetical protein
MSVMDALLPYAKKLNRYQHTQLHYYLKRLFGRSWVEKTIGGLHIPANRLRTHYSLDEWLGFFKFAFVRNPYDRVVSYYEFIGRSPEHNDHAWVRCHSFEDYVMALGTEIWADPQHYHRCAPDGEILVDFVGRFERLKEDFNQAIKQLSLPEASLDHINRGEREVSNYLDYLTPALIAQINKVYDEDFRIFKYEQL